MYQHQKEQRAKSEIKPRKVCSQCLQPNLACYCQWAQPVSLNLQFVILIHPFEYRRRIATGRLSHLCLPNSHLIRGHDFSKNTKVNEILADPKNHSLLLYPGNYSTNLTHMMPAGRARLCPVGKTLTIFVLDGTWATAKKMLKHSRNLHGLPRICFTPEKPSNFRIRKQPREGFYSTIEAIHHTIELLGPSVGFNTETREHDRLLDAFDAMVEFHLDYIEKSHERAGPSRYRRPT